MQFSEEFISSQPEIETLALIVPDVRSNSDIPVLIGTNTLDPLYEQFLSESHFMANPYSGYHQVLKTLQIRHRQNSEGQIGLVKLRGSDSNVIPAGQKVVLQGFASVSDVYTEKWALLEPPTSSSLLGGIFIDSCLITVPSYAPCKIPVVLRNETNHDIILPTNCVIAELSVPQDILPIQKHRPRPLHPQDYEAIRRHLQMLLEAGIIRKSESPFASSIVVVKKKNGDVRLYVDNRKLNMQTIKDAYALPNLEESFSALSGAQWFSVMDLKSGYYQIEMNESDKHKTTFVCPLGFWEWNRLPQGITNAPSTFQRLMEKCMGDINLREVLVFLDDIIVFSKTLEEHEMRLANVLNRLRENGLKLSPEKCRFFQTSVRYLGNIVSQNGIETDPQKIETLKTWPRPQTLKELRSFLGFSGYYRRFVKDYSKIVKPLTKLTAGYPPVRKGAKLTKLDSKYLNPKEPFGQRWTPVCQLAFEHIIEKLTTAPVLGFANPKLPYILHTDASTTGLGAALYQEQDGQSRVIAYASRGLSCSEARYPAHKLEFLASKWAITEKFHHYLYGNTFTVITDNNPLRYILTTAKLDTTSYRWLAALSTYSFDIKYRAGKQNQDADGLSRRPHGELTNDRESQDESLRIQEFTSHHLAPMDAIKATCQHHALVQSESPLSPCFIESLAVHPDVVPSDFGEDEEFLNSFPTIPQYSNTELAELQRTDPAINRIITLLESGNSACESLKSESPELLLMLKEMTRFELKNNVLYRRWQCDNKTVYQLVLPYVLRSSVLSSLHVKWDTWEWNVLLSWPELGFIGQKCHMILN